MSATPDGRPSSPDQLTDTAATADVVRSPGADDRLVRRLDMVRWVIAGSVLLLAIASVVLLLSDTPTPIELLVASLVVLLGLALFVHRRLAEAIAMRRASRETSVTRILQGLSRSLSPDAVVEAIVQELSTASGADHVVVARVRQADQVVEVTLSAARANVPASRTWLRPEVPALSTDRPDASEAELHTEATPREMAAMAAAATGSARAEALVAAAAATAVAEAPVGATQLDAAPATHLGPAAAGDGPVAVVGGTASPGPEPAGGASQGAAGPAGATTRPRRAGFGALATGARAARAISGQVPGRRAQLASQSAADEIARRVRSAYGLPYTLAAPLVAEGRFLGALILSKRTRDSWSDGDRRMLTWAAREVGAAFARAYALEEAERGANTDALTGLPNRRYFDELIAIVPHRRRDDLGIVMVDIDRFKSLNDRHGHATGDSVLRAVGGAIATTIRAEDTPARYGGEEFAVILRRASAPQATEVGERIRRAVSSIPPDRLGVDIPVTVSVGVAVATADEEVESVIERADRALYRAKRAGRDRVEIG